MILVSGATGFLGRHVFADLYTRQPSVQALVRSADKFRRVFPGGAAPLTADLRALRRGELAAHGIDVLVHLAAEVWPVEREDGAAFAATNLDGSRALLDALDPSALRHVVLGSTLAVCGALEGEITEAAPPRPSGAYAASKLEQEKVFTEFAARHSVPVSILRFSSIFGPAQPPHTVLPTFLQQARRGEDLVVRGPRGRLQNFLYVRDAVDACAAALRARAAGAFHVGAAAETTTRELAETIVRVTSSRSRVVGAEDAEPAPRWHLDLSKADRELEWRPRYELVNGLIGTIESKLWKHA